MLDISKLKTGDKFFLVRSYDDFYECEVTHEPTKQRHVGVMQRDLTGWSRMMHNWLETDIQDIYFVNIQEAEEAHRILLCKARDELKDLHFLMDNLYDMAFDGIPSKEAELYREAIDDLLDKMGAEKLENKE